MNPLQMMMGPMMQNGGQLNPMMYLMQQMQRGVNPQQIIQQMAQHDPQMSNFMKLIDGKNPQQLRQTAKNIASQRGTSLEQVAKQLGVPLK